jgi:putative ABC transport system ATP-binding protein
MVQLLTEPVTEGAEESQPAVRAVELVKNYLSGTQVRQALAGVSLEVPTGRFLSIMGPSGSGKSTLLHMLAGLDRPDSGAVYLAGQRLDTMAEKERAAMRRRAMGIVFQSYNLVQVLTVAENVGLPLLIDGQSGAGVDQRVAELLELCGISERARQLPSELSGGEQQRTAIARALVANPRLVLADEPTGNLDSATGAEVLKVLVEAQRSMGHTVVLVTHDPKVAATGDAVLNLRDGIVSGQLDLRGGRIRRPVDRIVTWLAEEHR